MKSIKKKMINIWIMYYQIIIPIFITVSAIYLCRKYKIYLWKAENYTDMLTAVITFLSIIISVFGILIPTVFTNKKENYLLEYFINNIDVKYFMQSIKRVMASGIISIFLVCALYPFDVIPMCVYTKILAISFWVLIYFLCGSYKYLSIMLRLIIEEGERYQGKTYTKQLNEKNRSDINSMLVKKYGNRK